MVSNVFRLDDRIVYITAWLSITKKTHTQRDTEEMSDKMDPYKYELIK